MLWNEDVLHNPRALENGVNVFYMSAIYCFPKLFGSMNKRHLPPSLSDIKKASHFTKNLVSKFCHASSFLSIILFTFFGEGEWSSSLPSLFFIFWAVHFRCWRRRMLWLLQVAGCDIQWSNDLGLIFFSISSMKIINYNGLNTPPCIKPLIIVSPSLFLSLTNLRQ